MSARDAVSAFATGEDVEVAPDRIDAELDRLWRELAREEVLEAGALRPMHRACLLNLVVHAGDEASERTARRLAGAVSDRFPARVVLVRAEPRLPDAGRPRAWIAAVANRDGMGRGSQVTGELIVIEAHPASLARIPPVVRAAVEPDMSTTLWWTGPVPLPSPYVGGLRDLADRVVVDSDTFPDDLGHDHLLPHETGARISDLAWPRLDPWRRAVSRAFDPPVHRALLDALTEITIGVGAPHGRPRASSGPLLAGWFAAALDWAPCTLLGEHAVCFPASRRGATATVRVEARPDRPAGVEDCRLAAGPNAIRFRRTDHGTVEADVPAGFAPVRPVAYVEPSPEDLLAATLLDVHADPIEPLAIRRAAEITAALARQ